ncbi:hypothetical protein GCM10009430_32630 [Aquimarina litoralis]|uniref:CBM6 domain-containing protein n=1 Tax=Aquimarina litoralis TaxID=584605 RepID=A0ABN1J1N4_9FLAO
MFYAKKFTILITYLIFYFISIPIILAQTFPGQSWETASPNSVGVDQSKLNANMQSIPKKGNVVVIKDGKLIYSSGSINKKIKTYSIGKSITSLIFARAMQMGRVNLEQNVPNSNNPTNPLATYKQFLSMTSDYGLSPHQPGQNYAYNNNAVDFYGSVLRNQVFNNISRKESINLALFNFIGNQDGVGFNGIMSGWGGGWDLSARDLARIGWLVKSNGTWNGEQIISKSFVDDLYTSKIPNNLSANLSQGPNTQWNQIDITNILKGNYSYGWWLAKNRFNEVNEDVINASGWRGNKVFVFKNHNIVIAVTNNTTDNPADHLYINAVLNALTDSNENVSATIAGEKRKFHKITLTWNGPNTNEKKETFADYRLNVTFKSPSNKTYVVPGYFAADGNAKNTSSSTGNKWRCHFLPQETGTYQYTVSFKKGKNIAASLDPNAGSPTSFHGNSGTFQINNTNKNGKDFRSKGKLSYANQHFLKWNNGEYFLKFGANSPEVFLEYNDFDGTPSDRTYDAHRNDWNNSDGSWKNGKGKNILGVVNYLSNQDINSNYFLTMNAYGDGKNAFPWTGKDNFYNYDVSKLDQWQFVFDHMMKKGLMVHFQLTERENQNYFEFAEGGDFAISRKIYYRELVARFGYLNAITWDIGEENGWKFNNQRGKPNTTAQRKSFADYLKKIIPYNDHIVIHNYPPIDIFTPLLGNSSYSGIAYQDDVDEKNGHDKVLSWINKSKQAGRKWVVSYDEPYTKELVNKNAFRKDAIWASITAGAAGVEFYMGGGFDLRVQNYREYSDYWKYLRNAKLFFKNNNIKYNLFKASDNIVSRGWCLSKNNNEYILYLKSGGSSEINLPSGEFSIKWYDPREGGNLKNGSKRSVTGGNRVSIGTAPNNTNNDWVIYIKKTDSDNVSVSGVDILRTNLTIDEGNVFNIDYRVIPTNASNQQVTWVIGNDNIVKINSDFTFTALKEGSTNIQVKTLDGNFIDTIRVNVEANESISRDAYEKIEAESTDQYSGIQVGSNVIGYFSGGDWIKYNNVDFGDQSPKGFETFISSNNTNRTFEIRIDNVNGPILGVFNVNRTGGFPIYQVQSTAINSNITGVHDIYLRGVGTSPGIANIDWFKFKREETSNINAFSRIQFENATDSKGVTIGSNAVSYFDSGDWIKFSNLNFSQADVSSIKVKLACALSNRRISLRANASNGPEILKFNVPNTNNWSRYQVFEIPIPIDKAQILKGLKDIYFVGIENKQGIANLDWFNFVTSSRNMSFMSAENLKGKPVKIYPNPVLDKLIIELDTNTLNENYVQIFNLNGMEITNFSVKRMKKSTESNYSEILIDLTKLNSGAYLLKVGNFTKQFIKR